MQFQLSTVLFLLTIASAITVSYDPGYMNASRSLTAVACSDNTHGLLTRGYSTQGSLPSFPNLGGAFVIAGYNDASCGTCWALTYNGVTIHVLAIDHTDAGFNIATEAMNNLTDGQAVHLGRIDADYAEVDPSVCGL